MGTGRGTSPRAVEVPADFRQRATRCELAIGFEGGGITEVDLDGRWLLIANRVALLDLMEEDEARDYPPVSATEFDSPQVRETHLVERYGPMLFGWRLRQCRRLRRGPVVGWTVPLPFGDGHGVVVDVERDDDGRWTAVTLEHRPEPLPALPGFEDAVQASERSRPAVRTRLAREPFLEAMTTELRRG